MIVTKVILGNHKGYEQERNMKAQPEYQEVYDKGVTLAETHVTSPKGKLLSIQLIKLYAGRLWKCVLSDGGVSCSEI